MGGPPVPASPGQPGHRLEAPRPPPPLSAHGMGLRDGLPRLHKAPLQDEGVCHRRAVAARQLRSLAHWRTQGLGRHMHLHGWSRVWGCTGKGAQRASQGPSPKFPPSAPGPSGSHKETGGSLPPTQPFSKPEVPGGRSPRRDQVLWVKGPDWPGMRVCLSGRGKQWSCGGSTLRPACAPCPRPTGPGRPVPGLEQSPLRPEPPPHQSCRSSPAAPRTAKAAGVGPWPRPAVCGLVSRSGKRRWRPQGCLLVLGRSETGYLRANKERGRLPRRKETPLPPPGPVLEPL